MVIDRRRSGFDGYIIGDCIACGGIMTKMWQSAGAGLSNGPAPSSPVTDQLRMICIVTFPMRMTLNAIIAHSMSECRERMIQKLDG